MDLIENLRRYGLTLQEAKIYIASIKLGEAKVSELAKISNVERAEGYRVLKRLQDRGLVEEVVDIPRKFRAYPPDRAVRQLIKNKLAEVQLLEAKKEHTVEGLGSLSRFKTEPIKEKFPLIQRVIGFENISQTLNSVIGACKKDLVVMLGERALNRDILILKGWKRAKRRSEIKLRILGTITKDNLEEARYLAKYAEVRHLDNVHTRIALCDSGDIIISLTEEKVAEVDSVLLVKSSEQASILFDLFEAAWNKATPLKMRMYELEKGVTLGETKVIIGKKNIVGTFVDIVKRAKTQVMFLADHIFIEEIFSIFNEKSLLRETLSNVKILILTDVNETCKKLFQNLPSCELRHLEKPRARIIISEGEILMGAIMEEELPNEAIWSNSEGIVNAMRSILKVHFDRSTPVISKK